MLERAEQVAYHLHQAPPCDLPGRDDATMGHVCDLSTRQLQDLWLYEQQLTRWTKARPTAAQRKALARVRHQLTALRTVLTTCFTLTQDLTDAPSEP